MSDKRHMTCEDFKDKAAAYALGMLDDAERLACASHLARRLHHRGCAKALEEARWVTARLSGAVPAFAPPRKLWEAISNRILGVAHPAIERRHHRRQTLHDRPMPHAHR